MSKNIFSTSEAGKLTDSKLNNIISSDQAVKLLQLEGEEKVLVLGAGNGYFTIPVAEATTDRVVAINPNENLLELLAVELESKKITNVERMPGSIDFLNLPDRSFHRVLAPFIFHELPDWRKTINEMGRVINEHGRLVIMEWIPKRMGQGPSKQESIPVQELADELSTIGFHVETGELNNQVYYITADKLENSEGLQT